MFEDSQTKKAQEELLVLLKIFDAFCRKNGVKYSLHGGTLLGAIREKGFIPWDDDVDITFTREEYKKFAAAIREERFDEEIYFDEYKWNIPKLWMCRPGKDKVWLDFFVYDYISSNKILQKMKFLGEDISQTLVKNDITLATTKHGRPWYQYIVIAAVNRLGKCFPQERKIRMREKFAEYCFCGKRELLHRSSDTRRGRILIHRKEITEEYILMQFEDTELMVSAKYEDILRMSYGDDYMIPKRPEEIDELGHMLTRKISP